MRQTPKSTDLALQLVLDPRRIVRGAHVGRLVVATAIVVAALVAGAGVRAGDVRTAVLAFVGAVAWTAAVGWRTEIRRQAPGPGLAAAQGVVDLLLTTVIVHVTGGGASQFAALYIPVLATAALLLPLTPALLLALLGNALYAADVVWLRPSAPGVVVALQLGVFAAVALGSGWVGARLREAGAGGERLAAALARARVEAADILRNIRSGIVTVDAHGRLLYANPAAGALLGLDLTARMGRPVLDEIGRVAPALADALHAAAALGARTTRGEGTIARPGAPALIGVSTTVSEPPAAAPRGVLPTGTAIFSDITDSKRLEALHLRAERLEAVAELSASLAHEIRNPLASIRSAVEQLARLATRATADGPGLDAEDADDVRTLAGLTVRESDRLSRLLTEFLDFARARVTRVERVDVGVAARDAARLAAAHPAAAGLQVTVAVPDGAEATVDGDPELLHRALFNLALNAAQATAAHRGAGGRVRLEVQRPDAAELPSGLVFPHGAVAVHVSDDGAGIAPELVGRLFEPFFTTRPQGSGLGLPIVQRAAEAHRGVVLVEGGGGGVGARFTLLLPAAAADASPAVVDVRPYLPTPALAHRAVA